MKSFQRKYLLFFLPLHAFSLCESKHSTNHMLSQSHAAFQAKFFSTFQFLISPLFCIEEKIPFFSNSHADETFLISNFSHRNHGKLFKLLHNAFRVSLIILNYFQVSLRSSKLFSPFIAEDSTKNPTVRLRMKFSNWERRRFFITFQFLAWECQCTCAASSLTAKNKFLVLEGF